MIKFDFAILAYRASEECSGEDGQLPGEEPDPGDDLAIGGEGNEGKSSS